MRFIEIGLFQRLKSFVSRPRGVSEVARLAWRQDVIDAPTDIHLVCDGAVETVVLRGNLFWCAWGMKGMRQAHPDFVEQWLDVSDPSEARIMLQRPSTDPPREVFIPRGTAIVADLIPYADLPPSKGHMGLIQSPTAADRKP